MEDKGMDLKFYQDAYAADQKRLNALDAELIRLNAELAKAPWGKRGGIKKSIKNVEQQITKITFTMRKTQENITEQTLALQGIDQDSSKIKGASEIVGGIAQTATAIMGVGGLSGIVGSKQETEQTRIETEGKTEQNKDTVQGKSNMMLYAIIGGGLLLFLMMKKK